MARFTPLCSILDSCYWGTFLTAELKGYLSILEEAGNNPGRKFAFSIADPLSLPFMLLIWQLPELPPKQWFICFEAD